MGRGSPVGRFVVTKFALFWEIVDFLRFDNAIRTEAKYAFRNCRDPVLIKPEYSYNMIISFWKISVLLPKHFWLHQVIPMTLVTSEYRQVIVTYINIF